MVWWAWPAACVGVSSLAYMHARLFGRVQISLVTLVYPTSSYPSKLRGKLWVDQYHQKNPIEPLIGCKKVDVNTAEACSLQL